MSFSGKLIKWYTKYHRDLPWRHTTNPYEVWLSEVILQQTRVDQGLSYYYKFTSLFPTIDDLANAPEDAVMKAWQGLGYYSRARNLQATARIISKMGGKFPENAAGLLKLKGIGPYTAAAIASFCFNEPVAVIDGNVSRVLTRLFGIELPIDSAEGKKALLVLASELIDPKNPATYNQAIMEFGALHCSPKNPKCPTCPFALECIALQKNLVDVLPIKGKKQAVTNLWLYYFFLQYEKKTYLRKRTGKGIWKDLHDFPGIESAEQLQMPEVIESFTALYGLNGRFKVTTVSEEYIHLLTHRRIYATFISLKTTKPLANEGDIFSIDLKDIERYSVSRLMDKFIRHLKASA